MCDQHEPGRGEGGGGFAMCDQRDDACLYSGGGGGGVHYHYTRSDLQVG